MTTVTKLMLAGVLGLTVALGSVPGLFQPTTAQAAAPCWKYAGTCRTYAAACQKKQCLQQQGYQACIVQSQNCWCVYYR
jgi:hypothetical protein